MLHLLSINISWVAYKLSYASSNRNLRTDYAEFHGISKRKIREIPRLFIPYLKSNCAM